MSRGTSLLTNKAERENRCQEVNFMPDWCENIRKEIVLLPDNWITMSSDEIRAKGLGGPVIEADDGVEAARIILRNRKRDEKIDQLLAQKSKKPKRRKT